MSRPASRLVGAHINLHLDVEAIQPYIDGLSEYFREVVKRSRVMCGYCGSLGVRTRTLSDDGHWADE